MGNRKAPRNPGKPCSNGRAPVEAPKVGSYENYNIRSNVSQNLKPIPERLQSPLVADDVYLVLVQMLAIEIRV